MNKADRNALLSLPVIILLGAGIALAGSYKGAELNGIPLFALVVGLAFLIQWLVFVPAYLSRSEKFFDITGSLTFITVTAMAVFLNSEIDGRSILLLTFVVIWAVRLGLFLFRRVHKVGKDGRFDEIKKSFFRFLMAWTIQGLWVSVTLSAALAAITSGLRKDLGLLALIGSLIWLFGFAFEVTADIQKNRFREDPANKGKFIQSGLWAISRHPNYFGEIALWIGIAVIALPVLQGWQWVAMISPVFVTIQLTFISGLPMLEKRADEKWGGQEDYEAYKERTPVLIPKLW